VRRSTRVQPYWCPSSRADPGRLGRGSVICFGSGHEHAAPFRARAGRMERGLEFFVDGLRFDEVCCGGVVPAEDRGDVAEVVSDRSVYGAGSRPGRAIRACMTDVGGRVEIHSAPGQGAEVCVWLS
jgi:hypothetical protein